MRTCVVQVTAADINMANASKKELSFAFHHRTEGKISLQLSNLRSSIIWRKEEKDVDKVVYEKSCKFVALL